MPDAGNLSPSLVGVRLRLQDVERKLLLASFIRDPVTHHRDRKLLSTPIPREVQASLESDFDGGEETVSVVRDSVHLQEWNRRSTATAQERPKKRWKQGRDAWMISCFDP